MRATLVAGEDAIAAADVWGYLWVPRGGHERCGHLLGRRGRGVCREGVDALLDW